MKIITTTALQKDSPAVKFCLDSRRFSGENCVTFVTKNQQDTKEYLNQRVPKSEFSGIEKKGGIKGVVKRGEVVGERIGPEREK